MTKFYTGKGDKGQSSVSKKPIWKDKPIFEALGTLDELNSWLGVCRPNCGTKFKNVAKILRGLQDDLFIIQCEVAAHGGEFPPKYLIAADKTTALEQEIERINLLLPDITRFVIAGSNRLSAELDYARTLARRAERNTKRFDRSMSLRSSTTSSLSLRPELLQYLNRLSSLLFALARFVSFKLKIHEEHPSYK